MSEYLYVWPDSTTLIEVLECLKSISETSFLELGRVSEDELWQILRTMEIQQGIFVLGKKLETLYSNYAHNYYVRTNKLVDWDVEVFEIA